MSSQTKSRFRGTLALAGNLVLLLGLITSCSQPPNQNITIVIKDEMGPGVSGLDLKAVGELVKKATNAQDLERLLNQPDGVNNLDLDHDGTVNYINVTEYAENGEKGFRLETRTKTGDVELAKIAVQSTGTNTASVAVHGNPVYYPVNNYYYSSVPLGEALLLAWLFTPHPLFYHPFYYPGFYPVGYVGFAPVAYPVYAQRTTAYTRTSNFNSSTRSNYTGGGSNRTYSARSPSGSNYQQYSSGRTGGSQRSFGTRSSGSRSSGGFGRR